MDKNYNNHLQELRYLERGLDFSLLGIRNRHLFYVDTRSKRYTKRKSFRNQHNKLDQKKCILLSLMKQV